MAEAPKRRPGRPRKRPLDKPEQFSIRLTPPAKVLLEMIARDRGVSLSQAIQQLIIDVATEYEIDGKTIAKTLHDNLAAVCGEITQYEERYRPAAPELAVLAKQTALFNSKAGSLFLMPERLLEPDELALVRACLDAGKLPSDDLLTALHIDSTTMITLGVEFEKVVEHLVGRLKADI